MSRTYEVVVYGATGFTGELVVEHLSQVYGANGDKLRWAIAGRSRKKLEEVRSRMSAFFAPTEENLPIIVADSADREALSVMCRQTLVVVSTVGPFLRYGSLLVECCISERTDYCDSTGETSWIRRMIEQHQCHAEKNKVRIVPSCGFDSLPTDLGVMTLVNGIKKENGSSAQVGKVHHYIGPVSSQASGGTLHTVCNIFEMEDKRYLISTMKSQYSLCPSDAKGSSKGDLKWYRKDSLTGKYLAPFFLSSGNERVVFRSWYLNNYGPAFEFQETLLLNSAIKAFLVSLGSSLSIMMFLFAPLRWLAKKFILPAPGTGPSKSLRDNGYAFTYVYSQFASNHYVTKVQVTRGDPGYKSTGMMLGESAVRLARSSTNQGGFFTPASCPGLGTELLAPLEKNAGISFKFEKLASVQEAKSMIVPHDLPPPKSKL